MNSEASSFMGGSVTQWIDSIRHGSEMAAAKLWERYVEQLVREADRRLQRVPRCTADGEDVAQEAFACFFRGIREGRFSRLGDRDDLWQILIMLTDRRAKDVLRHETAERRGGGKVRGHSGVQRLDPSSASSLQSFDTLAGPPVTPESAEQLLQLIRVAFPALADHHLQQIALDRAANYSDVEIARRQGISLRAVQRKLRLIRSILTQAAATDAQS
ncbi:MAG: ECF-type sigma factor [Pirellulaceae bacterium]